MFNMEKLVEVIGVVNRLTEAIDKHTAALDKHTQAIQDGNKTMPWEQNPDNKIAEAIRDLNSTIRQAPKPAELIGEGPPP